MMDIVKISPKFQVVIPKKMRDALRLRAGQTLQVIEYGNRIELIPEREISAMRGFLKGINTEIEVINPVDMVGTIDEHGN